MITNDPVYLTRIRKIIFCYPGQDGILVQPFMPNGDCHVMALSFVTDILWDNFTTTERSQILDVILQDIRTVNTDLSLTGLRDWVKRRYTALLFAVLLSFKYFATSPQAFWRVCVSP